jgi:exopolyphosphatase / guanosine-5'-triphosphate,3'-diphosphate pyrophosphatase
MMAQSSGNLLAAIDIGSSAIRMDIAEIRPDGTLHILDSLMKGIQLGKDAFTQGYLSEESIRAACEVLRGFQKVMGTYGVTRQRAVATSAVRESSNSENFRERVLMSTGLEVAILDGPEENRLTYSAVLESLKGDQDLGAEKTLLVEVGGGSTDVTLLMGGEPLQSGTFPLGSIRLRASVNAVSGTHDQQLKLLKRQIAGSVRNIRRSVEQKEAKRYVVVGGDVRFAARVLMGPVEQGKPWIIAKDSFADFVDSVSRLSIDAVVQKYALSYLDAETLAPALLIYLQILKETQSADVIVSDASIRTGILQDLMPAEQGRRLRNLAHQIRSAARSLGKKYQYDERHAERVSELATRIFDELKVEQRMNDTHRLYLEVASLLHDIGLFVSTRAHHKHSHYLISSSDLFGLRQRELNIIANVARYHRRALPQRSHLPFATLTRDERMLVSKLAAILRVANAIDKERPQKALELKAMCEGDLFVLQAQSESDLSMERNALAGRANLFAEVFGKKIVLREAVTGS